MTQASTNVTFQPGKFANTSGILSVQPEQLTVEFLTADPADLATTSPRIWVNTTSGTMKYTYNAAGTPVKTITAT